MFGCKVQRKTRRGTRGWGWQEGAKAHPAEPASRAGIERITRSTRWTSWGGAVWAAAPGLSEEGWGAHISVESVEMEGER